jgi:membrane-bound metal-dependent hydrolase YbcI (DUF457 family)
MPDPFVHVTVTVLALLLFYDKKYRRYALLLFPLAVLPDVDHLIPNEHRILLHNLFILLPVLGVALYARLKAKNDGLCNIALIAGFFLLSHIVLDFFTSTGVPLFYPLIATRFGFNQEIFLIHGSLVLVSEPPAAFVQSEVLGIVLTGLILPISIFISRRLPSMRGCLRALRVNP